MWINVAAEVEFSNGDCKVVTEDKLNIAVIRIDNEFFAIEDRCPHAGAALSPGQIQCKEIICPRHGARFSLKSGKALCMPAHEPVKTFPVQVVNGIVQIYK